MRKNIHKRKALTGESILNSLQWSRKYLGKSNMTSGNRYKITIERFISDNCSKVITFDFHDNIENKSTIKDWLRCLLLDSEAYLENLWATKTASVYSFMRSFGYNDYKQARKTFEACHEQCRKLKYFFSSREIEVLDRYLND